MLQCRMEPQVQCCDSCSSKNETAFLDKHGCAVTSILEKSLKKKKVVFFCFILGFFFIILLHLLPFDFLPPPQCNAYVQSASVGGKPRSHVSFACRICITRTSGRRQTCPGQFGGNCSIIFMSAITGDAAVTTAPARITKIYLAVNNIDCTFCLKLESILLKACPFFI